LSRPSFQFYHGDWISNAKLRRCTHEEKGVWIDILCLMADSDEFGVIRWPLKDLAQAVGARMSALQGLVRKGVLKGADAGARCDAFVFVPRHGRKDGDPVTLIHEQDGPIWYSSKQVRDDHVARARAAFARTQGGITTAPKSAPNPPFGDGIGDVLPSPSPSPSPLKASALPNPPVDNSTSAGVASARLRAAGVGITPANPLLLAWLAAGATNEQLDEAVQRARQHKPPPEPIPAKYLDPIVRDVLNPPPVRAVKAAQDAWWASNEGIDRKGRELGMMARGSESYADFKARIFDRLREVKGAA